MTIADLDALPEAEAAETLARCCGARRWVEAMVAARPFRTPEGVAGAAARADAALQPKDWLEAFSHHPRIGDREGLRARFAATAAWAEGEQAGTAVADDAVLDALAEGNRAYEARFGHIFIVCATGKSASEMLALLEARLPNDPEAELVVAAAEQAKITRLRLEKLLSP